MILEEIIDKKKERLIQQKKEKPLESLQKELLNQSITRDNSFYEALTKEGLSIIGEYKKASPSAGLIAHPLTMEEQIYHYEQGVDAISVLTEEDYFNGSVSIFKKIRGMTKKPLLRKDFIIDPYQIYEAKLIGANAILLITTALEFDLLNHLYELARTLELDVLMEVHNEEDLEKALKTKARIIGINNRNLKDFTIDLSTTQRLQRLIPKERLVVSESGIRKSADINFLKTYRINGILVGQSLMESERPKNLAREWKGIYGTQN